MKYITKIPMLVLFTLVVAATVSFAQHTSHKEHSKERSDDKQKTEDLPSGLSGMKPDQYKNMNMDSSKSDHKHMEMHEEEKDSSMKQDTSIVREGVIDLQTIDKNKDGKVYQDTMDWNVISDEPGKCPLCDMKLKEVSLDQAKENLVEHGFKVKEK